MTTFLDGHAHPYRDICDRIFLVCDITTNEQKIRLGTKPFPTFVQHSPHITIMAMSADNSKKDELYDYLFNLPKVEWRRNEA